MFKFIKSLAYNDKEHKIRGSFVTLCSTIALYIAFFIILFTIIYKVLVCNTSLSSITTLLLGLFSAMTTAVTVIFSVWRKHNIKKGNIDGQEEDKGAKS